MAAKYQLDLYIEKMLFNPELETEMEIVSLYDEKTKIDDIVKDGGIEINNMWYPYHQIRLIVMNDTGE